MGVELTLAQLEAKRQKIEGLIEAEHQYRQNMRNLRIALSPRDRRYLEQSERHTAQLQLERASVMRKLREARQPASLAA